MRAFIVAGSILGIGLMAGCADERKQQFAEPAQLRDSAVAPAEEQPHLTIAPMTPMLVITGDTEPLSGERLLEPMDANGDGLLSGDEIFSHFLPADANADGEITADELEVWNREQLTRNAALEDDEQTFEENDQ